MIRHGNHRSSSPQAPNLPKRRSVSAIAATLFAGIAGAGMLAAPLQAVAQDRYPSKPIKVALGFSAGGGTDAIARYIVKHMSETLGVSVLIDNKPGANGNIAAESVAKAPADGYTLLYNTSALASSPALYGTRLNYDVSKDLIPIGRTVDVPIILVVPANSPFNTAAELVAHTKANPQKLNYGSAGNGNVTHLAALSYEAAVGVKGTHVPYKGEAPAIADLIAGHIDYYFSTSPGAIPSIKGNRLKALAVASLKRLEPLPEVPTMNETIAKGLELSAWSGMMAPTGTPPDVIAKLNDALVKALHDKGVLEYFANQSAQATPSTPAEYGTFLKKEMESLGKVIKDSGLKIE